MVVLGIGDGLDAGAALVVDDRVVAVEVQARIDRIPRSRAFPWGAVDAVLREAGLRERDVDLIAVAGRFTPPLLVRKHPGLRRVARDAFSPALDATVLVQALLKESGLGAMEADRAQEWLEQRFTSRGFRAQRVVLVDIHKALASAAYRSQPYDPVTVVTLHPMGDGVVCAIHRGDAGHLDRVWEQRGLASLHVHLQRCASAMGFVPMLDDARLWALAGRGSPLPELLEMLGEELSVDGPSLTHRPFRRAASRSDGLYRALAAAEPADAAASVLANLTRVVCGVVAHHVAAHGGGDVAVSGAVFENPRLVAAVAALPEIRRLEVPPDPGWAGLPMGAAMAVGGLPGRRLPPGLGRDHEPRPLRSALEAAGLSVSAGAGGVPPDPSAVGRLLGAGRAVGRFVGTAGFGPHGAGTRSVLVRADDREAVARARRLLGLGPDDEPTVLVRRDAWGAFDLSALAGPARHGLVAPRAGVGVGHHLDGALGADRRVRLQVVEQDLDGPLWTLLDQLESEHGIAALAAFSLSIGQEPPVVVPADAVQVHVRAGLDALLLGPWLVERPGGGQAAPRAAG